MCYHQTIQVVCLRFSGTAPGYNQENIAKVCFEIKNIMFNSNELELLYPNVREFEQIGCKNSYSSFFFSFL